MNTSFTKDVSPMTSLKFLASDATESTSAQRKNEMKQPQLQNQNMRVLPVHFVPT